ncbi:hypothetical protein ROZALSC1DRAFT_28423 [Rozella allomycis CSF55]|uniref:Uncharacterized protein n=1 Tax=Rozella allomycis (strain CSF55) TaxID=988480 RepID=A0A075ASK7_ROZAC|nr:hypothetical protein O9G_001594 [Rozella allomycis CSF55]RKP20047.1 hypothetical protein ROZALSC1DRAFT_28423 [Rozella allomycis CSF55]|eukprot:EPZ33243.1 hypothetical protein O9G_001594 [Rozella allomycis CSF55]
MIYILMSNDADGTAAVHQDFRMIEEGLEPSPPKRSGPKPDALDHSAIQPCLFLTKIIHIFIIFGPSEI